jgi:membrane protein implicated in regulation of membrane protease activity
MSWWLWIVFGLVLAAIELATPGGFFVIFFGVSAIVVGVLDVAGVATAAWVQWLLFPVIALVALRLFRKPLLARLNSSEPSSVDSLVGEVAMAAGDIAAGHHGRAELRGTIWQARNVADAGVSAGQRTRVVAVDGLTLDIRPE